jgi:hypothetical protein
MLKKSGAFALMLLYVITAAGFALNFNYCCKRLTSVNIYSEVKTCGIHMGKVKCCETKHVVVKVKDAHQTQATSVIVKTFSFELPTFYFAAVYLSAKQVALIKNNDSSPPGLPHTNTLHKLCMLRI